MAQSIRKLSLVFLIVSAISGGITSFSCSNSNSSNSASFTQSKISSLLSWQISLRQEQLADPTPERLAQMQAQGMNTANLSIQRIYIYLKQPLTPGQTGEIRALGIIIYENSWVPPVGIHPDGYYLADLPADKLDQLTAKNYVVRLDTAERQLQPESDATERVR